MYLVVAWPFEVDRLNYMETFTELKQYFIAFGIFFCQCSDALETPEEAYNMVKTVGWLAFFYECFAIVLNIVMAIYESVKYYILEAKKKKYRKF